MNVRSGIRSPGRRGTAKALAPKFGWKGKVYAMKNAPKWAEEDREFYLLFQAWKKAGGKPGAKECAAMSLRFLVLEAQQQSSEQLWANVLGPMEVGHG